MQELPASFEFREVLKGTEDQEFSMNELIAGDTQYMGGELEMRSLNGGGSKRRGRNKQKDKGFFAKLCSFGGNSGGQGDHSENQIEWKDMNEAEKRERIAQLWGKARRYNNKLRFCARLQKMAESNQKEMMIDDINQDGSETNYIVDNQPKLEWYLIDTERTFCKAWNFLIVIVTIYNMFVVPYVMVFPDIYEVNEGEGEQPPSGSKLKAIELFIDIIYLLEIALNFVKRTRAQKELHQIARGYLLSYFIFDVVGTVPELLFFSEGLKFYPLKCARVVHCARLTKPLEILLGYLLSKYSKKRQSDLTRFAALILMVVYVSHVMACIWLWLGNLDDCSDKGSDCLQSWIFANGFDDKPNHTQYIFAFYWIFEVITTVGYGDYSGTTSNEYIFSITLEFLGLTFFSFLMGSINGIFSTSDNFEDLIEEKLDSLDMWIKKIEKSNKPFHIQPTLYNDIRKYVEQAFYHDFNLVIEEFQFYQ